MKLPTTLAAPNSPGPPGCADRCRRARTLWPQVEGARLGPQPPSHGRQRHQVTPPRTPWGTYALIADTLRQRITNGDYAPGSLIPSEAALSQEFGVARTTLRRTLAILESEGLIRGTPGIGRTVRPTEPDAPAGYPRPRYRHIADELQTLITNGTLNPGDRLPGETALAKRHNVARTTARQALQHLEAAGLIYAIHGKGRYVRQDVPRQSPTVRERPPQDT
jgi:DNA-binding GntR family transcriptional regulator